VSSAPTCAERRARAVAALEAATREGRWADVSALAAELAALTQEGPDKP